MSVPETEIVDDDELDEDETENVDDDDDSLTDNVGDPSVEINVEELLETLESEVPAGRDNKTSVTRHRLEEIMEGKRARQDLEDFDDYKV